MTNKKARRAIAGRSWLRGEVTLAEIRALAKPFGAQPKALFADASMEGSKDDVIVVDRALTFRGNFVPSALRLGGLVVCGDFDVRGDFSDSDDPATCICVLGDMRARAIHTSGALAIGGSLETEGVLLGFENEYSAVVRGDVRAPCFVPENHFFDIGGKLVARAIIGRSAEYRVPPRIRNTMKMLDPGRYRSVLDASVLEGNNEDADALPEIDYQALRARVIRGERVLLKKKSSTASRSRRSAGRR